MTPLATLRLTFGIALLARPQLVLHPRRRRRLDAHAKAFARVLGARHVLQAATLGTHPAPPWPLVGSAVDAVHAGTALVWAWRERRHRRMLLANAAGAALLSATGIAEARHHRSVREGTG